VISWLRKQWDERVSYEGGLSLLWMDGLLLIPLMMAGFFYPVAALATAGALLLVTFLAYEGVVIWKRRQEAPAVGKRNSTTLNTSHT
jgi:hypothetical protein